MSAIPNAEPDGFAFCSQCGRRFLTQDLARFGASWVCADCKNASTQRLREGAAIPGAPEYGGFWRRVAALIVDVLILGAAGFAANGVMALFIPLSIPGAPDLALRASMSIFGLSFLINTVIGVCYQVYFLTKSGATPGKMALGLKVVTAEGGPISSGRAIGRYFAYMLDSMILCVGYLIAAFDSQKRALHDYICNTRVIRVH